MLRVNQTTTLPTKTGENYAETWRDCCVQIAEDVCGDMVWLGEPHGGVGRDSWWREQVDVGVDVQVARTAGTWSIQSAN